MSPNIIILIAFILGMVVGVFIRSKITGKDGTLQIDKNNPKKDVYRLQLDGDLENLSKKKRIFLIVDSNAKLSQ